MNASVIITSFFTRDPQELVEHMLQKDPGQRLSAEEYMVKHRGKAFPDVFYTTMKLYQQQLYVDNIFPPDDKILL